MPFKSVSIKLQTANCFIAATRVPNLWEPVRALYYLLGESTAKQIQHSPRILFGRKDQPGCELETDADVFFLWVEPFLLSLFWQ